MEKPEDVMFSPAVKAEQVRLGSREAFEDRDWQTEITDDLRQFLAAIDTFFFATASADGRPYIQHRGGPAGFLRVLDEHTIGFVDFVGNRQYITAGNLAENPKVHLFLMDYAHQQRIKIWGEAHAVENDAELTAQLMPADYKARAAQVILLTVAAWDANCPQHIPQLIAAGDVANALAERDARIRSLEIELHKLRTSEGAPGPRTHI